MSTFKEKCNQYFGTTDFYKILSLNKTANEKEIKKAYHKLSLLVHPDRVEELDKEVATEKFKVLGRIHSILQNKSKRKVYDDHGDIDDEIYSTLNWMQYWSSVFKKIELKDIQNYEKTYIGSETEKRDIKRAYEGTKGNMDTMLQLIQFSNPDSEARIIEIVREMVNSGEVEEFKDFFNESKSKKLRRQRKWEKEKKEAEMIDIQELEKKIEENRRKRGRTFGDLIANLDSKYSSKKAKKTIIDSSTNARRLRRRRK